ncbi:MAG: 6-bladed beta-propeller [Gemmatimonadota bacterium]
MPLIFPFVLAALLPAAVYGQPTPEVLSAVSCESCEVVLVPTVTLGDEDGPGMLEFERSLLAADARGRYYVYGGGSPYVWVFGSDGELIRRVGNRGEGPGEFLRTAGVAVDPHDSVYVFDGALRRMSVFTPDLEFGRTASVEFSGGKGVFLGVDLVVNAGIRTPERVGYPLHIVEPTGETRNSFGPIPGAVFRPDLADIIEQRAIGVAGEDAVWAGRINEYLLEKWDRDGTLRRSISRETEWFPAWWEHEDGPPTTHIRDLQQTGDTLWVMIMVPGQDWQDAVRQVDGGRRVVEDRQRYQDTIIEAIDLTDGTVLVSSRIETPLGGFAGPNQVYGWPTEVFDPVAVHLWELRITHPNEGR